METTPGQVRDMPFQFNQTPNHEQLETASHYFELFAEPIRLRILSTLRNGERTVNEIAADINAKQSNVSHKLKMLHQSRILVRRKEGTQVFYSIGDQNAMTLCRDVCRKKAIGWRNAGGGDFETCRLPDRRCSIGGGTCQWEKSLALVANGPSTRYENP